MSLLVYTQDANGSYTGSPFTYVWNSQTNRFVDKDDAAYYFEEVTARQDGNGYDVSAESGHTDGHLTPASSTPLYEYEIVNGGTQLQITFPQSIDVSDGWLVVNTQPPPRYYNQGNSITEWTNNNTILTLTLDSTLSTGEYLFAITGANDAQRGNMWPTQLPRSAHHAQRGNMRPAPGSPSANYARQEHSAT